MVESKPDESTTASKTDPEMSMRRSIINSSNLRTALLLISNRIRTPSPYHLANASSNYKHIHGSSMNQQQQGLRFLSVSRGIHSEPDPDHPSMMRKDGEDKDDKLPNDQTPVTPPPKPTFFVPTWARWVLGSILTILLPFWKQKWEKLVAIEGAVEVAAEEIEVVAEEVEKVANVAEKVSEDLANDIPKDGPLKEAALFAELVSKEVAKEAHETQEIIHTVEELKEEVETLINPFGTKGKDAHEHK